MDSLTLDAVKRSAEKPKVIRTTGAIPAVYYGNGITPTSLQVDYQSFRKVYEKAGGNTIIELGLDGKKTPVLVHDIQFDPVSDAISHVDFIHVDMTQEVSTTVKIAVVGVSPAVKNLGGVLDIHKHEIKIKCLPKDLIHSIEVDITPIVDFHTAIHVSDLKIPSSIKVLDKPEDTIATVVPPRAEEATQAAAPVAEGAVTPAEGAAAPAAETTTEEAK